MADQIRITPGDMRERAKEYRIEADNVNDVIGKMDSLLSTLQSEWEGSSSEAYAEKFGELRPGFIEAEKLIRDIAEALDRTANIIEQTDADIANQFRM